MKLKTLVLTVALLAILSAGAYVLNRPRTRAPSDLRVNQPLVDASTVEKVAKIKISDQGKTVELVKQTDGTWRVASYHDFPADFQKLSEFVGNLTSAKVEQAVTSNPERLSRLEFKDTKLALFDSGAKPLWSVTLGKNADAGGRFVRFGEDPKAYRANLSLWLDAEPKNWTDTLLVSVKPEEVAKVEISLPSTPSIIATRAKKDDPFTSQNPPAEQRLKNDKVTSLISSLTSMRFSDTSDPADANAVAARQHERTVKLTTFDGKTVTVALGRKPEQRIVKPPTAKADGKSGPAALGKIADAGNVAADKTNSGKTEAGPAKIAEPETETIPAGPVYAAVADSDAKAAINGMMAKRAFQVFEYAFTSLPQKPEDLFEPAPSATPAPMSPPVAKPAAPAK